MLIAIISLTTGSPRAALRRLMLVASLGLVLLAQAPEAGARDWFVAGLTFSDELGGFRLLSVSGEGTIANPIVLVEEITGPGPATLLVRNHRAGVGADFGMATEGDRYLGLALVKIVTNRGKWRWSGFEMELREEAHQPSVYTDGLSFDQIGTIKRPLHADRFNQVKKANEPYDRLVFDRGRVDPDEVVTFAFNIVDLSPRALFFLVQEPIMLLSQHQNGKNQQVAGQSLLGPSEQDEKLTKSVSR
jgi:hypothetical protein